MFYVYFVSCLYRFLIFILSCSSIILWRYSEYFLVPLLVVIALSSVHAFYLPSCSPVFFFNSASRILYLLQLVGIYCSILRLCASSLLCFCCIYFHCPISLRPSCFVPSVFVHYCQCPILRIVLLCFD